MVKEDFMVMARKENCWRIRLETGLARKRSKKFYKLIAMESFCIALDDAAVCCQILSSQNGIRDWMMLRPKTNLGLNCRVVPAYVFDD